MFNATATPEIYTLSLHDALPIYRQICESWTNVYPGRPFVTLITDLADFPPRFWIEPISEQYVIAGTEKAAEQARALGHDDSHIFRTSGMILRQIGRAHV